MNAYDLIGAGLSFEAVLSALSPRDRKALEASWDFWARPGQLWRPGPEFITDFEAGRGWGKDRAIAETIAGPLVAGDPERWGGHAIIVGPDPTQVKRDCLFGPSGLFPAAERTSKAGLGPAIIERNLIDRWLRFEAPRGGGTGLTVYWASSYDPKSVHGANVGLVWWDEFGVSYHDRRDDQGNNAWEALLPAVRAGPDPKIVITQTPSRRPEVRALQRNAERPPCPKCQAMHRAWRGEEGREPWRLPPSPQHKLHPLLDTRTTEPIRTCPKCHVRVVAEVRCVYGATTDNPAIATVARERAAAALATGQAWARLRFAPRGEVDSAAEGALIREDQLQRVAVAERASPQGRQIADRWMVALAELEGVAEVVVAVDPASTASGTSDETGIAVVASRRYGHLADLQAVALEDASVSADDVLDAGGGAPSAVWAPRAFWTAVVWGATRIVVEVNQGGDEVVSALREYVRRPLDQAAALRELRARVPELAGVSEARLGTLVNRLAASSRGIKVETIHRRASKATRFEWYGATASLGRQAVASLWWLGAGHWQQALGQATSFEPTTAGRRTSALKDRWDAVVSGAEVVLGVRETHRGEIEEPQARGWLGLVGASALR